MEQGGMALAACLPYLLPLSLRGVFALGACLP